MRTLLIALLALILAACGSVPTAPPSSAPPVARSSTPNASGGTRAPAMPAAGSGRGGYYQDDGPGESPPDNLLAIPDAEPKLEPNFARNNKPYVVFGKTYTPLAADEPLKQRGVGSWYGKKFHGQKTSSGEPYDMYKMTAAHPTMPLPSYVRVTNLANGKQVIVRVNDRGPFHSSRIIDLSYTAALKLGYLGKGSSELEIERLLPDEIARMERSRQGERALPQTAASAPVVPPAPAVAALDNMLRNDAAPPSGVVVKALPPLTETPPAPTVVASAAGNSNIYLQLGAFAQAPNAEAVRARMLRDAADPALPMEVVQSGAVYRLFAGPFSSRSDAAAVMQKMQDLGGLKPFIVLR
ncbi:rare lipoprotein A [Actimicrobium sp. GrIS 1.19]|uniref:septal ring lytic transglycosylase RlpA family protein n=1 Tax=Actimicrobium sp. GrIS 1.19 TaxID=3071708 RepID=UPI002E04B87D|nr:rare lipoprotein A [Actimicrobium sp. GrIS 1.19]